LQIKVEEIVKGLDLGSYVEFFNGEHRGYSTNEEIVASCWNLKRLNRYYADFISRYEPMNLAHRTKVEAGDDINPRECFFHRFMLTHEYRLSPYVDPNLPLELLPSDWLGERAIELFQEYRHLLAAEAEAFVDSIVIKAPRIKN
jgi:phenylacetic acid degradation operon negative regulatory protein